MTVNPRLFPAALAALGLAASAARVQAPKEWPIHDRTRPLPPVVDPGTAGTAERPGTPPSDAIVLFGGKDLAAWRSQKDGGAASWKVENGHFEVVKGAGG